MRRYSGLDIPNRRGHRMYCLSGVEDVYVLLPTPVYWLAYAWRNVHILYLGFRLDILRWKRNRRTEWH